MSEEMKNSSCNHCGTCEGMHGHKKHMMVKIFMLVVIILAFCLGNQIGELKGELRGSYGHGKYGRMMNWGDNDNYGYGMMGGYGRELKGADKTPTTTTPVAPVKTN